MQNPLIGMPQGAEWLVILVIVILIFGAAKLPDLARSSGQALRIFRNETKSLDDESPETPTGPSTPPQISVTDATRDRGSEGRQSQGDSS